MLTFFFDGVPVHDSIDSDSSIVGSVDNSNSDVFRANPIMTKADYVVHYPYQEKECLSCHDENSKSELIAKQPDLCYMCHDDFSKIYKYLHGPVAAGYCTACHNPHMSKEQKLLTRSGQQVCLYCHETKDIFKNENHKDIAEAECTICHNPHGGGNKFLLN
jgi:predicted CXXCH cytochrome family protein